MFEYHLRNIHCIFCDCLQSSVPEASLDRNVLFLTSSDGISSSKGNKSTHLHQHKDEAIRSFRGPSKMLSRKLAVARPLHHAIQIPRQFLPIMATRCASQAEIEDPNMVSWLARIYSTPLLLTNFARMVATSILPEKSVNSEILTAIGGTSRSGRISMSLSTKITTYWEC